MTTFQELGLPLAVVQELRRQGITTPTDIQAATIPDALNARDILGKAPTGSGKTLAFSLPTLSRLAGAPSRPGHPRALVLVPTRELAFQIKERIDDVAAALGLRTLAVVGGVNIRQDIRYMAAPVDFLIATPGRAIDLLKQRALFLDAVETLVIDECNQMTDLGFLPQVRQLASQLPKGQRLLFSATLHSDIEDLMSRHLRDPVTHSVAQPSTASSTMRHYQLNTGDTDSHREIVRRIAAREGKTLLFLRTRYSVDRLVNSLQNNGISAIGLHGKKGQATRTQALEAFSSEANSVLVATDIAARGIDVSDVSLVVHVDPPLDPNAYTHRAGRTARAGASGTVVTLVSNDEQQHVASLFQHAGIQPEIVQVTPHSRRLAEITGAQRPPRQQRRSQTRTPAQLQRRKPRQHRPKRR